MIENFYFRRIASKAIDLIVAYALASLCITFLSVFGVFVGMAYILFADGMGRGEGVAKRFFHLRVSPMRDDTGQGIDWKQSFLRNFPFALLMGMGLVPLLGGILGVLFGIPYCIFEIYLFYSVASHHRLGDVLAQTRVVDLRAS